MVHYLPTKMTNQIVSYSANPKDHPSHNNGSKSTCLNWHNGFFETCQFGFFYYKI